MIVEGADVRGVILQLTVVALTLIGVTQIAQAEDLVMPFACTSMGGQVGLTPANDTAYKILGRRDEQPFVACGSSKAACETMMVHRFSVECGGNKISWARIADGARTFGVMIPAGLPNGFAPVSTLSGRFVLPAVTSAASAVTPVTMHDLSPDSVTEQNEEASPGMNAAWVTEVTSDAATALTGGNAVRVAGSLVTVLVMLFLASLVAAGRWNILTPVLHVLPESFRDLNRRGLSWAVAARKVLSQSASHFRDSWDGMAKETPIDALSNAFEIVRSRFSETQLGVTALAPDLLLRDVLNSELRSISERLTDVERQMHRRTPAKSSAIIRTLARELDRIARISQSASHGRNDVNPETVEVPQSIAEAYRVLGMNGDAAPAVAKKLVDVLRMSWHPDHARDEPDRLRRESRMKQINAAWDLINDRRAAA
jgi:hypothetical protein